MTRRRPAGAAAQIFGGPDEDKLTRLIRMIARQAAQEAFEVFKEAVEESRASAKSLSDPQKRREAAYETASNPAHLAELEERYLGVAGVAKRLDVSKKTVRRKIAAGELPAHRVGKLLRIGERDLATYAEKSRFNNK
jgi:excisionase family DNA binding protein